MINCIVAIEKNQGIGFNNQMPWPRLTQDLKWFKEKTTDNVIIMGRKTWESIGSKNLPNRINIVISSNFIDAADRCFSDTERALDFCKIFYPYKEVYIIGGSAIYDAFMNKIQRFYITEIEEHYTCDKFFDFSFVQKNFTNIKNIATFNDPIKFTIKEYTP